MAAEQERANVLRPGETDLMPERLYVAARPDGTTLMLELREYRETPVVVAFSSLDGFLAGCGADQPWVLLPAPRLAELAETEDGRVAFSVLLDVPLDRELRGTAGGMADAEAEWGDPGSADWAPVHVAARAYRDGDEQAQLELQPLQGNRMALMAYSSRQSLRYGCGPGQPGVVIPAGLLGEARRQSGADTICLDTPLPAQLRHDPEQE